MPRYREIAPDTIIDAAQWHIATDTDTDPVALEGPADAQHGVLYQHDGQQRVEDGDYICRRLDGTTFALTPAAFELKYEPAPDLDMAKAITAGEARVNTPSTTPAKLGKSLPPRAKDSE